MSANINPYPLHIDFNVLRGKPETSADSKRGQFTATNEPPNGFDANPQDPRNVERRHRVGHACPPIEMFSSALERICSILALAGDADVRDESIALRWYTVEAYPTPERSEISAIVNPYLSRYFDVLFFLPTCCVR
jgi:hypothetical protein